LILVGFAPHQPQPQQTSFDKPESQVERSCARVVVSDVKKRYDASLQRGSDERCDEARSETAA
jgi:hypothetical protein